MKLILAIILTIILCTAIHFCQSKKIRVDREKAEANLEECRKEKHKIAGELADKSRVPKWQPPKYKFLNQKGDKKR